MLLQHLRELISCGIVDKIKTEGYPLHVEYYLTERGRKLLEAVLIMQEIGIEYMVERVKPSFSTAKAFVISYEIMITIPTKSG